MKHYSLSRTGLVQTNGKRKLRRLAGLAVTLVATTLSGCNDRAAARPCGLRSSAQTSCSRAACKSCHVNRRSQGPFPGRSFLSCQRARDRTLCRCWQSRAEPGQVLALLDPAEQQADVDAASAAVAAAESQLRVAKATFERQKSLISSGFTTRPSYDQAQEGLRIAEGALETAKAQLGSANEALSYTALRAEAAGVITARNLEVGQVVQVAQTAFRAGTRRGTGRGLYVRTNRSSLLISMAAGYR